MIELQDHGAGVPADQIEQLLKPFTRMDSARGQANGAGLGLAIVERVVSRHNAELTVRNRDGGGLQIELVMAVVSGLLARRYTDVFLADTGADMVDMAQCSSAKSKRPPRASRAWPTARRC